MKHSKTPNISNPSPLSKDKTHIKDGITSSLMTGHAPRTPLQRSPTLPAVSAFFMTMPFSKNTILNKAVDESSSPLPPVQTLECHQPAVRIHRSIFNIGFSQVNSKQQGVSLNQLPEHKAQEKKYSFCEKCTSWLKRNERMKFGKANTINILPDKKVRFEARIGQGCIRERLNPASHEHDVATHAKKAEVDENEEANPFSDCYAISEMTDDELPICERCARGECRHRDFDGDRHQGSVTHEHEVVDDDSSSFEGKGHAGVFSR